MGTRKSEGNANPAVFRFSERMFRRYEQVFLRLMGDFNKPFVFNLQGSVETHLARVRDAARSLIQNRWVVDFDIDLFSERWDKCKVTQPLQGAGVLIYDYTNANHFQHHTVQLDPDVAEEEAMRDLLVLKASNNDIDAMLVLMNNEKLPGWNFQLRELAVEQQQYLRLRENEFPNACIDQLNDDTFMIL